MGAARKLEATPGLRAASAPRRGVGHQRLLHIDTATGALEDGAFDALSDHVRPGDVWVLNDAATLPASLRGTAAGRAVELRLLSERADGSWWAVLFGEGSWRDDTDRRPAPPVLAPGDRIALGELSATVRAVDPRAARLVHVDFEPGGDAFWRLLYAGGRPVQYSYVARDLELAEVQTPYAGRPWSVEPPSAGRPLSTGALSALRRAGAQIVTLTHAAGLSATGDPALDARLPLPERYELPEATARAVARARREGRRVVAVGTSTTRALEGNARDLGALRPGVFETDLVLGPRTRRAVVDALLTGAHDPASSHFQLLCAFAPAALLDAAVRRSAELGYLGHELGDSWLVT
ncbi:MAG: S-adenosylmethionine:tRNA ribosyltransferase-isomerase [Sandaracinaceae bacterium]|nr:S-adenosylmethionine:tRNA ribosyltransferase-isomerase [Sandaracinaceae bacterium]